MPVNVVPELPRESSLFRDAEDGSGGTWEDFQMVVTYESDAGVMQIPVAGPNGTPAMFTRTQSPTMRKAVSWRAMKHGTPPAAPCPEAIGDNDVFLGSVITPAVPMIMGNGIKHTWSIAGVYYYGLKKPVAACTKGLPTGANPAEYTPASLNSFPPEAFHHDLLTGTDEFTD